LNIKNRDVIIIGAGKIAHSLVPALQKSGYNVAEVISRKLVSAKKLAVKYGVKHFSDNPKDIRLKSGIVFLCVPDAEIRNAAKQLLGLKLNFGRFIFIHMSGALDISCLNQLKKKNGLTASFHIMQTFPSKKPVAITGCYAAIETDKKPIEKVLFDIAGNLALKPFALKSSAKTFYHIAGVFASNFLVGNMYNAESAFKKTGNKNINFYELISPILFSTLSNINKTGAANALSGPVERGDIETIKKHLEVLKKDAIKRNDNSLLLNYIAQSLNLLEVAKKKHGKAQESLKKTRIFLHNSLKNY